MSFRRRPKGEKPSHCPLLPVWSLAHRYTNSNTPQLSREHRGWVRGRNTHGQRDRGWNGHSGNPKFKLRGRSAPFRCPLHLELKTPPALTHTHPRLRLWLQVGLLDPSPPRGSPNVSEKSSLGCSLRFENAERRDARAPARFNPTRTADLSCWCFYGAWRFEFEWWCACIESEREKREWLLRSAVQFLNPGEFNATPKLLFQPC